MLNDRDALIEEFGLYFEHSGLPRILGRIYGLLLITDEYSLGLDDLKTQLIISKASASTGARQLTTYGMISKVSRPGDRRDYYRAFPDAFLETARAGVQRLLELRDLLRRAVDLASQGSATEARLRETLRFYDEMELWFDDFVRRYLQSRIAPQEAGILKETT